MPDLFCAWTSMSKNMDETMVMNVVLDLKEDGGRIDMNVRMFAVKMMVWFWAVAAIWLK